MDTSQAVEAKYRALAARLDEATLRLWAAAEARSLGRGGVSLVAKATGLSRTTVYAGLAELDAASDGPREQSAQATGVVSRSRRIRAAGGGRKRLIDLDGGLLAALDALVEPASPSNPMSALRWTCKSTTQLAHELNHLGHAVSQRTVCDLLVRLNYSLRSVRKAREGANHPDRDAQFHHIAAMVMQFQRRRQPVISVDTQKKELRGGFRSSGHEQQPVGRPKQARVHDFIDDEPGKVVPTGVDDLCATQGWVSVGIDHDTAQFAVQSIRRWWLEMGRPLYPKAKRLLITADCGGSNGYRARLWRLQLQHLADEFGLAVQVCHFPPGTSKWKRIEHRMICRISNDRPGGPLLMRQSAVKLIGGVTTGRGLRNRAELGEIPRNVDAKVTERDLAALAFERDAFHGEWNYRLRPRPQTHA